MSKTQCSFFSFIQFNQFALDPITWQFDFLFLYFLFLLFYLLYNCIVTSCEKKYSMSCKTCEKGESLKKSMQCEMRDGMDANSEIYYIFLEREGKELDFSYGLFWSGLHFFWCIPTQLAIFQ